MTKDPKCVPLLRCFLILILACAVIYPLSFGPILRFYGVRPSSGWERLPPIVRKIYDPLDKFPFPRQTTKWLRNYNRWWMRASTEKDDFIKLVKGIDDWLQPGLSESELTAYLGQPLYWRTNAGTRDALYYFTPPMVPFDVLTNGFDIEISNGRVVAKKPIKVLSGMK